MEKSGSGRSGCRARPRVEPLRVSGSTEGTASHKVRPYHESIASSHWFGIRVHPGPSVFQRPFSGSFRSARPGICLLRHFVDFDQRHAGGGDLRRLDLSSVGTGF
jgi:hypothetical protein